MSFHIKSPRAVEKSKGSRIPYSSDREFLSAIRAEDAVISVGGHNSCEHPTWGVPTRLQACGYHTYRTDLSGTVEVWIS